MTQGIEITLPFNEVLTNFDLQRFIDVLDDYYQAVSITPDDEWDKRLTTALGLDLWEVLIDAGHDIVDRIKATKQADHATKVTLEAEAAPRIHYAAEKINFVIESDILFIRHPHYLDFDKFGFRERMLLDWFGWFSEGGFDDDEVEDEDQKRFWDVVKEMGKLFAELIQNSIYVERQGRLLGQTLLGVFTGDSDRAARAVRRHRTGQPERTITVKELAELHGVNVSTARRWCDKGQIQGVKRGRDWFVPKDVAESFQPPRAGRPRGS